MPFTDEEVAYLGSQRLARISTVPADGQPDVAPVGFEFDGTYFDVGGIAAVKTRKIRNVEAGNTKVALVIDDLPSVNPWTPRYLRIYGTAELVERTGHPRPSAGSAAWPSTRTPARPSGSTWRYGTGSGRRWAKRRDFCSFGPMVARFIPTPSRHCFTATAPRRACLASAFTTCVTRTRLRL